MDRLVIYDAHQLDCSPLYELSKELDHLIIGERTHPLTAATADETATIVTLFVTSQLDKKALVRMPHLRLVICLSTGTNHVDVKECAARGITVCNVPSYGEHTVAEYTFALMLALVRRLPEAVNRLRAGQPDHADLIGADLDGKTLTVIGTGHIGRNVIKLARAFRMTVLGVDPYPDQAAAQNLGFQYLGLHEALSRADVISLHAPYTREDHHMINRKTLALTKPGAILINTARGELVDTTALLHALHTGRLAGAGLDVIEGEALLGGRIEARVLSSGHVEASVVRDIAEHEALLNLPNVLITNHNAFNTREAQARIVQTAASNIRAYFARKPVNLVKP